MKVYRIADLATTPGKLPVSAATIWRWAKCGTFPAPFKLGPNTSVFDGENVDAVIAARAAGQSEDEIRKLVAKLAADRKHLA